MTKQKFYPELWIQVSLFGFIFLFALTTFVMCLAGFYMLSISSLPGAKGFAICGAVIFAPVFFTLTRGTWQLFNSRLRYLNKYSTHDQDTLHPVQARCLFSISRNYIVQPSLISLVFDLNSKHLRADIQQTSVGFWFSDHVDGDVLNGEMVLRDGKPYLFRNSQFRIWLTPEADKDKPSSTIGARIDEIETKVKDARANAGK